MRQVQLTPDYPPPLPQRLAHQPDLSMLQIAQASVNDPRGSAGRPRSKIMLLDQKRPLAGTRTRHPASPHSTSRGRGAGSDAQTSSRSSIPLRGSSVPAKRMKSSSSSL